jgi:hypothetical protein
MLLLLLVLCDREVQGFQFYDVFEDEKEMFFLFFIFECFGEVAVKAVIATTLHQYAHILQFSL